MTDWAKNWRGSGFVAVLLLIVALIVYGKQPGVGASAAVVLVLLGGTTFASNGFWAPDGAYAKVAQLVFFVWIAVLSGWLVMRSPSSARAPERATVPTA